MITIAPSILSADFSRLAEEVRAVEAAGAHWLHVDVMDGHFVPNITFGPLVVRALRRNTHLPLDVHLMIETPERYLAAFAEAGADRLTVHVEACPHLHRMLQAIKELDVRAGVALNPHTPLTSIEEIVSELDLILIMSVNPGFGGQRFLPLALDKLRRTRALLQEKGRTDVPIEVDGGIKLDNARQVVEAGANVQVSGSGIFGSADPGTAVREMRRAAGA